MRIRCPNLRACGRKTICQVQLPKVASAPVVLWDLKALLTVTQQRHIILCRPDYRDHAKMARWLIAENDWGVVSTTSQHLSGVAFGYIDNLALAACVDHTSKCVPRKIGRWCLRFMQQKTCSHTLSTCAAGTLYHTAMAPEEILLGDCYSI